MDALRSNHPFFLPFLNHLPQIHAQIHLPAPESQEVNSAGARVLCRTETFASHHTGFNALLRGPSILGILNRLAGEPMLLFKEKINYKFSGSGGFAPHIDSTAYTHIRKIKHLTILLAVDAATIGNGGLEIVSGSDKTDVPISRKDNCIESEWVKNATCTPCELQAGELLVFGSHLAHRSGANKSSQDRRAVYATYNCKAEGDLSEEYYRDRAKEWPATHMRKDGEAYAKGALRYGFGSPMLSVASGIQLEA
ncbi:MAG: hypothetical protein ASARMPREDX12_008501 [Alectoria sarmentosa]|nr:MAG: hypothetical protein ASARMPREDX12_008501 [Alectoria sarmentosa]